MTELYHTKNYQGTITPIGRSARSWALYHTKNYQGTITRAIADPVLGSLYHTKNYQGTPNSCAALKSLPFV